MDNKAAIKANPPLLTLPAAPSTAAAAARKAAAGGQQDMTKPEGGKSDGGVPGEAAAVNGTDVAASPPAASTPKVDRVS